MLIYYPNFLWIALIIFIIVRMLLPKLAHFNYVAHSTLTKEEKEEFKSLKDHNITLASFVIVLIAIILAFPQDETQNEIMENLDSLLYFSIAMTCFFIASYFSLFQMNSLFLYVGDTIETTGILSLGIGFLFLISNLTNNNLSLQIIFVIFLAFLAIFAIVGVLFYKQHFFGTKSTTHRKTSNNEKDNVIATIAITTIVASMLTFVFLLLDIRI